MILMQFMKCFHLRQGSEKDQLFSNTFLPLLKNSSKLCPYPVTLKAVKVYKKDLGTCFPVQLSCQEAVGTWWDPLVFMCLTSYLHQLAESDQSRGSKYLPYSSLSTLPNMADRSSSWEANVIRALCQRTAPDNQLLYLILNLWALSGPEDNEDHFQFDNSILIRDPRRGPCSQQVVYIHSPIK